MLSDWIILLFLTAIVASYCGLVIAVYVVDCIMKDRGINNVDTDSIE